MTIYIPGGVDIGEPNISLFDWVLREQERLQSLIRRYQSPDEYPFFPEVLQEPILKPLHYPQILHANDVNVNPQIKDCYINHILPAVCQADREDRGESEENYGSSSTCDVMAIQSLSRRIHFGKFVAESKFQKEPERFAKMIKDKDRKGIDEAITNAAVEKKVLERLRLKAKTYGTDPDLGANGSSKVNADAVVAMYKVGSQRFQTSLRLITLLGLGDSAYKRGRGRVPNATTKGHTMGVDYKHTSINTSPIAVRVS